MRSKNFILVFVFLTGIILLLGEARSAFGTQTTPSTQTSRLSETKTGSGYTLSQKPRHLRGRIKLPLPAFVAGESGYFDLEIRIDDLENVYGIPLKWDRTAISPAIALISSQKDSGLLFIDPMDPKKRRHHHLVRFDIPEGDGSQPLTACIAYSVEPRTKAEMHTFDLDISAELITENEYKIHDMGLITVPFKVDTHFRTKLLMLLVVAVAVALFIMEWVRVDVVGILMMVLLPQLGLLDARDTFRGLSSNAVVAIIGVMIISYGLNRVGLVNRIIQPLLGAVGKSATRLAVIFSGLIAAISGVMQNTGAAVLFLPAIRVVSSQKLKIHISRVLMPIGMAAILGGTLTMIGTSPLILLNDILPPGMPKIGFLELTPIGLALVIGGIAYLSTAGMRMLQRLPVSRESGQVDIGSADDQGILGSYPIICGPYEIYVPEEYRSGNGPQEVVKIRRQFLVNIVAAATEDGMRDIAPLPNTSIRGGFVLCAYGPEEAVRNFVRDYGLVLRPEPKLFKNTLFNPSVAGVVEGVVSPRSGLIGKTIKEIRFRESFGVNPLALRQDEETYYQQLADRPLQSGDMILIHGTWEQFQALQDFHQNLIIISPYEKEFHKPEKAKWGAVCFGVALVLMIVSSFYFQTRPYNPIPLSVCLMVGALGMVLTRVMTISEAYRAVDWRTVFLLGGLIPLGMAVDQTGTAQWIAKGIVTGLGSLMTPLLLLVVLACLSCGFTMVISNVGACALLVPLGISIAHHMGIDPRVAAIVVGIGVSNSFMLPTHQVNALYMGPGEYRSKDYLKIGGLLSLIYIVILVAMTYFFYM